MKRVLLIAVTLIFVYQSFGQTYVGAKAGYTMSKISFEPVNEDVKMLFGGGFDFGVTFKHYNAKYVGFQAELYTTHRGYRVPTDETNNATFERVNTYIELPIFIQFRLNLKIAYLHVNAGPYISYLLAAKEGDNTSGSYKLEKVDFNVLRDNRVDYGLMGGVGLSYDFKWGTIQAEARISYGYADLYDHTYTDMPKESKAVTQQINVGYFYRFGSLKDDSKSQY
ncbi:MAG: porin family protein [Bacteroidales bacterium]